MTKVYKYPLRFTPQQRIDNIKKPLHVALQNGVPMLWAESGVEAHTGGNLEIFCIGTGYEVPSNVTYISTVMVNGYVFHFYYRYI